MGAASATLKSLTSQFEALKSNQAKDVKTGLEAIYQLNEISSKLFQLLKDSGDKLSREELDQVELLSQNVLKLQTQKGQEVRPTIEKANDQLKDMLKNVQ